MGPGRWRCLAITLLISDFIEYGSTRSEEECKAASAAIDDLHDCLPKSMSLEIKCKFYAVMLNIVASKGQSHRKAAAFLSKLDSNELNLLHHLIDEHYLASLYIDAIDGYRFTSLRPPFLDLIDCLRPINRTFAKIYLSSEELTTTAELYRHVLRWPSARFDLGQLDLGPHTPEFRISLENLFRDYLIGASSPQSQIEECQPSSQQSTQPAVLPVKKRPLAPTPPRQERQDTPEEEYELSPEQLEQQRRDRRRETNRERMRKRRQEDPEWYREQDRLRQQRLRLVNPDGVRARERDRQRRRRARLREEERQALEQQRSLHLERSRALLNQQQIELYDRLQQLRRQAMLQGRVEPQQPPTDS